MPNMMGHLSESCDRDSTSLTHKAVKIGAFIRYNYTASHLRSIINYT